MQEDALQRLQLESDFRLSLVNRDFILYYQPVVDITTNTIAYCEALVRWQHPTRGLTFPNVFLPLAEETGLVVPMGWQLLHQACRQVSQWSQEGMPIAVSVNLAAEQFASPRLKGQIEVCLSVAGIEPSLLKLEVTESALIAKSSPCLAGPCELQSLGLQVYLDDFGTGYSSLAYLERFPLYGFVIDRAFVQGVVNSERRVFIFNKLLNLVPFSKWRWCLKGSKIETNWTPFSICHADWCRGTILPSPCLPTRSLHLHASSSGKTLSERA